MGIAAKYRLINSMFLSFIMFALMKSIFPQFFVFCLCVELFKAFKDPYFCAEFMCIIIEWWLVDMLPITAAGSMRERAQSAADSMIIVDVLQSTSCDCHWGQF